MLWNHAHRRQIEGLIRSAKTSFAASGEYQARVIAALEHAPAPARPRSRRRLVAILAGAVVIVMALGFVPFPAGNAKGALTRALAAAEQLTTLHKTRYQIAEGSRWEWDEWYASNGFNRSETREDGTLVELQVRDGAWTQRWTYTAPKHTSPVAWVSFSPLRWRDPNWMIPEDRAEVGRFVEWLQANALTDIATSERREYSVWRGSVDVAEIEGTAKGDLTLGKGHFGAGDRIRFIALIDPATDRLVSERFYHYENGWKLLSEERYEWDPEIPQELHEFHAPEGAEVHRDDWWVSRVEETVAEGETASWHVAIHAIDVNRNGDIYVSLSRERKPDGAMPAQYNGGTPIRAEATDDTRASYEQQNGYGCANSVKLGIGYWVTRLNRDPQASGSPHTLVLTISPYPEGVTAEESVTFTLPLPPRQDREDLTGEPTE